MSQTAISNSERLQSLQVGDALPQRALKPDEIQLFFYNAALWNAHRIHFDLPYAQEEEGYPGLVIAGPMLGDWLNQCVEEWVGDDGRLVTIEYSNRAASYIGETLTSGGEVTAVDTDAGRVEVEVFIKNEQGDVITPGKAVVQWGSA